MKRRTFINSLIATATSMGVLKGIDLSKEVPAIKDVKELISFQEFFFIANGFPMNPYQELYYNTYTSAHNPMIIGGRQKGMSTLMNTIILYEHKVLRKSIAIIPSNFTARLQLENNLYKITENLFFAGLRWESPLRPINIIGANGYSVRTDLLFVNWDGNNPSKNSNYYQPSQKQLSDRTVFFGTTEA